MNKILVYPFCLLLFFQYSAGAQTNCKDIDLLKRPGKWIWKYDQKTGGVKNPDPARLWATCEPVTKELQRTMPQPPEGAIAHTIMTEGGTGTFYQYAAGPRYYQYYLMIKDYECIMHPNAIVQPEGETGCWIYIDVNNHREYGMHLPGGSDVMYDEHRRLYLTSAWLETDANNNLLLYTSTEKDRVKKEGFVFSDKNRIPYRKITRRELFSCYKTFHEKRVSMEIARFEKIVLKNDQQYNALTAAQKKEQSYWPGIIARDKKVLQSYKNEKEKISRWYTGILQQPNLGDTAYAQQIASWAFEPDKLDAAPGTGNPVWVDDADFYDRSKPINQPQYIFLWYRHQDQDLPKKNFMEKFTGTFNLDILWKLIGQPPRKPGGTNTIVSSFTDAKQLTKTKQGSSGPAHHSFDETEEGKFPAGWRGMNNIGIQTRNGSKWLAMTKDGYWYPRQYNQEIKDGFDLSFDLQWNSGISYYSGYFTLALGEMKYDNAGERYYLDDNRHMYMSLYDGYAGEFNRVVLWFDPYWNGGGTLEVYSYDRHEAVKFSKKIVLPGFYREKNAHRLSVRRKGNSLLVMDNGAAIADLPDVFLPGVTYNLCTFSRYKGDKSEQKDDVFFIKNISLVY